MPDPPPELPGFEIIAEMGHGTTGVVYQVRFLALDRVVALQILTAGADRLDQRRFERAARILTRLTHDPHIGIPKLSTVGEWQGRPYVTREYIEGETLESLTERKKIDLRAGVRILQRVAEIVSRVHAFDVVHRNLQPANVLVGTDERVWLIGFGRCRLQDAEADRGTPDTPEADVQALRQFLNWLCDTLAPDPPDWISPVRQRAGVTNASQFAAVLGECLD